MPPIKKKTPIEELENFYMMTPIQIRNMNYKFGLWSEKMYKGKHNDWKENAPIKDSIGRLAHPSYLNEVARRKLEIYKKKNYKYVFMWRKATPAEKRKR